METVDHFKEIVRLKIDIKFSKERFQQTAKGNIGIKDIDGLELLLINTLKIGTQDGRFPQANLTDNRHKPLTLFDAIDNGAQRGFVTGTQKEEVGVWSDMKWRFLQLVKV
jgi:hypothetical protein